MNTEEQLINDKNLHIPASPICNNNCMFCMERPREVRKINNGRYTLEVVTEIIEKYKDKVDKLIFTSGEPTLNPMLLRLINLAKKTGYTEVSIITNGRMLSYIDYARQLVQSGLTEISVSIHGHDKKIHDSLTRSKGSFNQTVKGIENISELRQPGKLHLNLAVTLNKMNYKFFGELVAFFYNFNFTEIVFNVVQPINDKHGKFFHKVIPRYSDVAQVIEEFYLQNRKLFIGNSKEKADRVISIIDLPFCQSRILTDFLGYGENRIIEKVEKDDCNNNAPDSIKFKSNIYRDNKDLKVKREECENCVYYMDCNGVYYNYIQEFGWDEFIPVV